MRELGPVQFVLLHDDSERAIARAQQLMPYGRKLCAELAAIVGPGVTLTEIANTLDDGSEVTAMLLGASELGAVRQYLVTIRTSHKEEKAGIEPFPYFWAGARWMYEEVGGHWLLQQDRCLPLEENLGMEVFEPLPGDNQPTLGPSDQLHVSTWNYQELDFPWRNYWNTYPEYITNRHNNNPGVWAWYAGYYTGTQFENHPANSWASGIPDFSSPMWVTYTDRWMYQTNWVVTPIVDFHGVTGDGISFNDGSLLYASAKDGNGKSVPNRYSYMEPPDYPGRYSGDLSWAPHDPTDPRCLKTPYPWSVVTVLDPYEGLPVLPDGRRNFPTDARPYRAWKEIHAAKEIFGVTTYGAAQVRPGDYTIRLFHKNDPCTWYLDWRHCEAPPIELKVMVGKAPFTSTRKYRVEIGNDVGEMAAMNFAYGRNLCWPGLSCCGFDRWLNIKSNNQWQDAVIVDVIGGSQGKASDLGKSPWPATKDPAFEDQRMAPDWELCGWSKRVLIIVGVMPFISYWAGVDDQSGAGPGNPELSPNDGLPQAFAKVLHEFHRLITGAISNNPRGWGHDILGTCINSVPIDCYSFRVEAEEAFKALNGTLGPFALRYEPEAGSSVSQCLTKIPLPDVFQQNIDPLCLGSGLDGCKNWPDWMKPYICEAYDNAYTMWWYSLGQSGQLSTHALSGMKVCGITPVKPGECCQIPPGGTGDECGGGDPYGWL